MLQQIGNGKLDLLTAGELNEALHRHMENREDRLVREIYQGIKVFKLPVIQMEAPSASFTLADSGGNVPCGPESGYLWLVRRVLIASSGGVAGGTTQTSNNATAAVTASGGTATINTFGLPTYFTGFTLTLAPASAAGNGTVTVSNVQGGPYVYNFSETTTGPTQYSVSIPAPGIQASGNISVAVSAVTSGGSGSVSAYGYSNSNVGDNANPVLYAGSDTGAGQATILEDGGIKLGTAYYPASKGAWLFPGEQLYAKLTSATTGNLYTMTGVAIEVPFEMQGKIAA
jgi:hypothetical protein